MRTLDLKWTQNLSSFKLKKKLMENSKVSFYDIQIGITVAYNGKKNQLKKIGENFFQRRV